MLETLRVVTVCTRWLCLSASDDSLYDSPHADRSLDASHAHGAMSDSEVEQAVAAVQDAGRVGGLRTHVAIVAFDDARDSCLSPFA